jgi:hypothetical protein
MVENNQFSCWCPSIDRCVAKLACAEFSVLVVLFSRGSLQKEVFLISLGG